MKSSNNKVVKTMKCAVNVGTLTVFLLLGLLLAPVVASADGAAEFRLVSGFKPMLQKCPASDACEVTLVKEYGAWMWQASCTAKLGEDVFRRLDLLKRREADVVAIVVSKAKRAVAADILDYIDERRQGHLLDSGRLRLVRLEEVQRHKVDEKLLELCAPAVALPDGMSFPPNTAIVFVGDKGEAPKSNPCKDERWRDGVTVLSNMDDIDQIVGRKLDDLISTKSQIEDIKRHERKACEETGDASAFIELVFDPVVKDSAGDSPNLSASDLGLDNAEIVTQLRKMGVEISSQLSSLFPADVERSAMKREDGKWALNAQKLRSLMALADSRAGEKMLKQASAKLIAQIQSAMTRVERFSSTYSGGKGPDLSIDAMKARNELVTRKYGQVCGGSGITAECSSARARIDELEARLESFEKEPAPIAASPVAQAAPAKPIDEWSREATASLQTLQGNVVLCKTRECLDGQAIEYARLNGSIERYQREYGASVAAGKGVDPRIVELENLMASAEADLGAARGTPASWSKMKIGGVAALSAGGLIMIAAIVPLLMANSEVKKIEDATNGGIVPRAWLSIDGFGDQWWYRINKFDVDDIGAMVTRQRMKAIIGWSVLGAGALAAIAGGVLLGVDAMKEGRNKPTVTVAPVESGAVVGVNMSF